MSVVVVGCGHWGKNLVRNFAELGALSAVVDGSPQVAAQQAGKYSVRAVSFEGALAMPDVSGIVIATPAETHADLALAAFAAGKHVYVEKPIALTPEDGEKMKAAAQKADRILMVGHLLQYHPAFETLLAMVRAGELGALRYAYSNRLSLGKFRLEENALWSFAPHDVSMLLALFGEAPVKVRSSGGAYVTPGIEDECRLDMTFADGRRAHVFASWLHPFKEHRLVVVGEKAMMVFEDSAPADRKLMLYRHVISASPQGVSATKADGQIIAYPAGEPLAQECAHFLDCIAGKTPARTDADEALRVLRVLSAAS
jgi:predicted dehydrogenase